MVMRKTGIKVTIHQNRVGAFLAVPVSAAHQEKYADYMAQWKCSSVPRAELSQVYFQHDGELPESILSNKQAMLELEYGFRVTIIVDPWEYGHWLGYDAHAVQL